MSPSSVNDQLELARDCLVRGDSSAALEHLLAAWREARSPRIAELIDEVSLRMDFGPPLVDDLRDEEGHRAWLELAARGRADDLWRLLLSVGHDIYWIEKSMERLRALAERDDPRLATALADMLHNQSDSVRITLHAYRPKTDAAGARAELVLEMIARIGDLRSSSALRQVPAHTRPEFRLVCREVADQIDHTQSPLEMDASLQALCSEISMLVRSENDGDRLWDAIASEPDDDERRLAYAEWLREHGDEAQAEFIALQILAAKGQANEEQRAQAEDLLTRHRERWIGPFAHLGDGVEFERGLPVSAGFGWARSWFHRHLIGHRLWSTVREVWGAGNWRTPDEVYIDALSHPRMNNLRSVETTPTIAAALAAKQTQPWTSLRLFGTTTAGGALPLTGTIGRLPNLTHLGISELRAAGIRGAEERCASVLAERKLRLTVQRTDDGFGSLQSFAAFFAVAQASRFVEVQICDEYWDEEAVIFSRDDAGNLSIARGTATALIDTELAALPAQSLTQIIVEGPSDDADLDILRTTVASLKDCELIL